MVNIHLSDLHKAIVVLDHLAVQALVGVADLED
jgi:hypothetical protein